MPELKEWSKLYSLDPDFADYPEEADKLAEDLKWMRQVGSQVRTHNPIVQDALDLLFGKEG